MSSQSVRQIAGSQPHARAMAMEAAKAVEPSSITEAREAGEIHLALMVAQTKALAAIALHLTRVP